MSGKSQFRLSFASARHGIIASFMVAMLGCVFGQSIRADPIGPVISASVNGARSVQTFQGWPVLLEVALFHPEIFDSTAAPLSFESDAGRWSDFLRLEITDAFGTNQSWPLALLNSPAGSFTLDGERMARLFWSLSPQQTALIATGSYIVTVVFDSTPATNQTTWKGTLKSLPIEIGIGTEPSQLTPAQQEIKFSRLAEYHSALGNPQEALNQINLLLLSDSNNIGGLSFKSSLLRELGRNREALDAVNQGLNRIQTRFPNAEEPPRALLRQRFELTQLLLPGRIHSIFAANDAVALEWNANPGHAYNVEGSRDLTNWTRLVSGLVAETNLLNWATHPLQDHQFFRISP